MSSFPAGATVAVDGVTSSKVTPMNVSLPVGAHTVTLLVPGGGWMPETRTVTITPGDHELHVTLVPVVTVGSQGPPGPKGETGAQGARGDKGDTGAQGAQGLQGLKGDKGDKGPEGIQGPKGDQGKEGATGATGAQGTQGPAGPAGVPGGAIVQTPPPPPYAGTFLLAIDGAPAITLNYFAGCFEKEIGVEYEDCHFATTRIPPQLLTWLNDSISGNNVRRQLTLYRLNSALTQVDVQVSIANGFLREFAVAGLDEDFGPSVVMSFVVVPASVNISTGGSFPATQAPAFLRNTNFRTLISGVDGSRIGAIEGLRMSWPKMATLPNGTRRTFDPGLFTADNISITASAGLGSTLSDIEQWVSQVAAGTAAPRDGDIELVSVSGQTVQTIELHDLVPLTFQLFPTGTKSTSKTLTLRLGHFEFQ